MHVGSRCFILRNQLFLGIHFHVILVPIVRLVVLLRPTRIAVFLPPLCASFLKSFRPFPFLDLLVFLPVVALARHLHKTRIHDTALPPYQPSLGEDLVKPLEQPRGAIPAIPFQRLLEVPNRPGIRYRIPGMQPQKIHETKPIPYLKLTRLIAQAVKLLQHQHFEHQHRINGRTASPGQFATTEQS